MIKYKIRLFILSIFIGSMTVVAQNKIAEQKTKQTEAKMTDDELFSLITSLVGYVPTLGIPKDNRIPNNILMSAEYKPGIPRLGIPNIQSTDASMGVTNPGYRPDDKNPGKTKTVKLTMDKRIIADFNWKTQSWEIKKGEYTFALGKSSTDLSNRITIKMKEKTFKD